MSDNKRKYVDHQGSSSVYLDKLKEDLQGPGVTVDGIQFCSDRFYLNHVKGVDLPPTTPSFTSSCTCGAEQAPPLFSRERLVKSLSLKAAIMGSFSVDDRWLHQEFPDIFGRIPTLVLHGDKKLKRKKTITETEPQGGTCSDDESISELENSQPEVKSSSGQYDRHMGIPLVEFPVNRLQRDTFEKNCEGTCSSSVNGGNSFDTQQQEQQPHAEISAVDVRIAASAFGTGNLSSNIRASGGNKTHFTYVHSCWKKTGDVENQGVSVEKTTSRLETKRGVFHPKFMILFETSGSVVVVVSTANLVQTRTVEGSWVQRFFPSRRKLSSPRGSPVMTRGNDFGTVLQDFLCKLDESATLGDTKIGEFFLQYLSFGLDDFADSFLFHHARVHLIPVVPGDFSIKSEAYGRLRVDAILRKTREQHTVVEHKKDLLILQPTSFGGNWKQREMADMVRSYLSLDKKSDGYWDDEAILRRMNIVWPSRIFMENLSRDADDKLSMDQVEETPIAGEEDTDENTSGSSLFMSSRCFNSCEMACLSRMSRFQWSDPPQRPSFMVPHFKSVCRVIRKSGLIRSKHGFNGHAKTYFSWFLMTSACLSHGAQGQRDRFSESTNQKNTIRFANFELGILFISRIEKSVKILYTFHPQQCSCQSLNVKQRIIHLPVPWSPHVDPYLPTSNDDAEEDYVMKETPFLHLVEAGSRCVGNMMMTPYGIRETKKPRKEM